MQHHRDKNFCRVFELPLEFPNQFCFGGGIPSGIMMVDWFGPLPSIESIEFPDWNEYPDWLAWDEKGEFFTILDLENFRDNLRNFIRQKRYIKFGHTYLILTDFGDVFLFEPTELPEAA